ncbi:hypothetical protein [Campylobacter sp. TTU_617]|uniref:hypothetical protein n=1 Tax=Campylobacter sp. TTU_617 TaxID=2768148 RepID=UPI001904E392|nr:hypothetical protein [Campylobacter sp. TTU_617]MBK1971762.1 hypothetical protein [Campylobacter sp. TTU_617]
MKNHLSYKLGETMVKNSFTLKTLLKNPLDLLMIYLQFKKDKFKHDNPLSSYKDYESALKFIKAHPYYKIGYALIKAQRMWYKGGYFIFIKELKKIAKEYKYK